MIKRMVIMLLLVGLVLGGVFGFQAFKGVMIKRFFATQATPPQTVSAIEARTQLWQPQINAVGTLVAENGTDIAPELPGVVYKIHFKSGEEVRAGTLLVELNTDADRAQLLALKAAHTLAQKTYARNELLFASHTISNEEFDTSRANLDSTAAQVEAQTALVEKKMIRAPFAGRLGIRTVDLGQYVNPGTKLVNIQQLDPIFVDFFLAQKAVHDVRREQRVIVHSDALPSRTFEGRIFAMDALVDVGTRNVKVRAEIRNPEHLLLPGMFVTAQIEVGQPQEHITLPQSAISFNPYGNVVFTVVPEGAAAEAKPKLIARQKFVTTGDTRGDQIAVVDGLKVGELVVTAGQIKLRNDTPVIINNAIQPADNPAPAPVDQ